MAKKHVILGGGQAGSSAAAKLRELDGEAEITLVCAEPVLPYQRPPLSKAYLKGDMAEERLYLRPASFYEDQDIALRLGAAVTAIDPDARTVAVGEEVLQRLHAEAELLGQANQSQELVGAVAV